MFVCECSTSNYTIYVYNSIPASTIYRRQTSEVLNTDTNQIVWFKTFCEDITGCVICCFYVGDGLPVWANLGKLI